jgi:hypothetical protein
MKQLFQIGTRGKLILSAIIAFTISVATSAQPYFENPATVLREVRLTESFDEIKVLGNVTIILTNNLEGSVVFRGNPRDVQHAKATIKNGKLMIDANRASSFTRFTVYVPVSNVNSLITSGQTEIFSSGTIRTQDLEILLNGSSSVSVKYDGKLKVIPGTGYELVSPQN